MAGQVGLQLVGLRHAHHAVGVVEQVLPVALHTQQQVAAAQAGFVGESADCLHHRAVDLRAGELRAMQDNWPKIQFHALREHAGLVFQKQLEG